MKKRLVFKGPVLTSSGYGVHARQLLRAVVESGEYDVGVVAINWGRTPFVYDRSPEFERIFSLMRKHEDSLRLGAEYDVSVQVTIPNEFEKMARVNVGVTAGIEVDRVSPQWISKANELVDLVVVPSTHSARTFLDTRYKLSDGRVVGLEKPLVVCPEGVDVSVFNGEPVDSPLELAPEFNFLAVGLGFERGFGEDRKNLSTLVKWFCEVFKGEKSVGLVLKASMVNNSLTDFEGVRARVAEIKAAVGCGELPRVVVVHGRLSDKEMAALYKNPRIKALVSLTHGEGFGLPILEAAACGLPVVATNWSGHLDFLNVDGKRRFVPIEHELAPIPKSAVWEGVMEDGSRWAYPKEGDAKLKLRKVVASYDKPREWAGELGARVREKFSLESVGRAFLDALRGFLGAHAEARPRTPADAVAVIKKKLGIVPGQKTLLFTMPMSAGDVFVATAVVYSLKKKFSDHRLFFATDERYVEILRGNKDVDEVVRYEGWMADVPFCERVFDQVYTPNLAIQTVHSNWVHGGKGRLLGDEMAAQCRVEFGECSIERDPVAGLPEEYVVLHPGSGKGQWEARSYLHWQEVVDNVVALTGFPIVQVGQRDDPLYQNVVDLRGRTTYNQLADVVARAACLVGIDTVSTHMAAALGTPHVAIYGSSYSTSTGPVNEKGVPCVLIDTPSRYTCEKACYKYQCTVDRDHPCVNEIAPRKIVEGALSVLYSARVFADFERTGRKNLQESHDEVVKRFDAQKLLSTYKERRSKIAGYTHVLDAESRGFPYVESILSMLGFCDEVVVVDGGSTDGTLEKIRAIGDPRIKVLERKWDLSEPGMDGMQKAFGRAMCSVGPDDFLWQQDADEVVHEDDYEKIRRLVRRFPRDVDVLHLPVVELWGDAKTVRTDRHAWKWRLSRNSFRVTHGINKDARVVDQKTGRTHAKKGASDGCEYVDIMTGEHLPHKGFWTDELELLRRSDPAEYGRRMNAVFGELPSVFHYSWADIPRKIRNFKQFWNVCWSNLYADPAPVDRFPDVATEEDVLRKAIELKERGGEHGPASTFVLGRTNPAVAGDWLGRAGV